MSRGRGVLSLLGALALVAGIVPVPFPEVTSAAAAGTTETGETTRPIYTEDFEGSDAPSLISGYVSHANRVSIGSSPYSADAAWSNGPNCNGIVLRGDADADLFGCDSGTVKDWMAPYAAALGEASGIGAMNHALASATRGNTQDGKIFGTSAITGTSGRFLWASADVAGDAQIDNENNCTLTRNTAPAYTFRLRSDDGVAVFGSGGQTVCDGDNRQSSALNTRVVVSTLVPSNGTALYWPHSDASLEIWNETATSDGQGDDGAIDNIRIADVTPTVSMQFADSDLRAGGTATLRITVSNTSNPLGGYDTKSGWGFQVTPQNGLEVVDAPSESTCGGRTSTVGGDLRIDDGMLSQGSQRCTIAVHVKQASAEDPGVSKSYAVSLSSTGGVDATISTAAVRFEDAVAPTVPTLQPSDGAAVSGVTEAGATVTVATSASTCTGEGVNAVALTTATVTAGADGTFTVPLPRRQPDGSSLFVSVADAAGNHSACTQLTVLADPPPAPDVSQVADGMATGTALPGTTVVVTDARGRKLVQAPVDENGLFRLRVAAPVGSEVALSSRDAAGNRSEPVTMRVAPATEAAPAPNRPVAARPLARDESSAPMPARTLPRTGLAGTGWPTAIALLLLTGLALVALARVWGRRR